MKFYKVTNQDECHYAMKYHTGLNEDVLPFWPFGNCTSGGIYFAREDILAFLDYGPWIREVTLPEGEEVYENPERPGEAKKFKAHRVILGERRMIDANVVRELIAEGADPKIEHSYPLRWAAVCGYTEIVKVLLEAGADPKEMNSQALRWAAENGHFEIIKLLLEAGADPKANYSAALRVVACTASVEIVKMLLKYGADPKDMDSQALYLAAVNGRTEIVRMLLEAGADPNANDSYAYSGAAFYGHPETVKVLRDWMRDWLKEHP